MRSYQEEDSQISLANLGSYLDMNAHGLYCICRLLSTICEGLDNAGNMALIPDQHALP